MATRAQPEESKETDMALPIPQQWKNLSVQPNGDTGFDLGTFKIVEEGGTVKIRIAPAPADPWGDNCTVTGTTSPVVIKGTHFQSGRQFEITFTKVGTKWTQSGKLTKAIVGPEGTWTADEGP